MLSLIGVCTAYIYYNSVPDKKFLKVLHMLLIGTDDSDWGLPTELSWILEAEDKQQAYTRARRHIQDMCNEHGLVVSHLDAITKHGFSMDSILKHAGLLY